MKSKTEILLSIEQSTEDSLYIIIKLWSPFQEMEGLLLHEVYYNFPMYKDTYLHKTTIKMRTSRGKTGVMLIASPIFSQLLVEFSSACLYAVCPRAALTPCRPA